jgi:small subunit ribosomal protein S12
MPTLWQLSKKFHRPTKFHKNYRKALRKNPQKAAHLAKNIIIVTPRKPNSARRKVAWVRIIYKKHGRVDRKPVYFFAHLNGDSDRFEKYFTQLSAGGGAQAGNTQNLRKDSLVLIRGGRTKDLPGLKYKMMRSKRESKYTLKPLPYMKRKRSKYAAKKVHTRKGLRNLWKFNFKYQ